MSDTDAPRKSFWSRPEGTTGMVVGVGLAGLGAWGFLKAVPFLILAMQSTIHLAILCIVAAGLGVVVLDRRNWMLAGYAYQVMMRRVTGWFITIDPIGILETYVQRINDRVGRMQTKREALAAKMSRLKSLIDQHEREANDALEKAANARAHGKQDSFALNAHQAERLKDSNVRLTEVYTTQRTLFTGLDRYIRVSQSLAQDIAQEVRVKKEEREQILGSYGLMREVRSMLSPDASQERELFERTMEHLTDDYGQKVGEIEAFVDMSSEAVDSMETKNGVYEERAIKMIEAWQQTKGATLLEGPPGETIPAVAPEKAEAYQRLFK